MKATRAQVIYKNNPAMAEWPLHEKNGVVLGRTTSGYATWRVTPEGHCHSGNYFSRNYSSDAYVRALQDFAARAGITD